MKVFSKVALASVILVAGGNIKALVYRPAL